MFGEPMLILAEYASFDEAGDVTLIRGRLDESGGPLPSFSSPVSLSFLVRLSSGTLSEGVHEVHGQIHNEAGEPCEPASVGTATLKDKERVFPFVVPMMTNEAVSGRCTVRLRVGPLSFEKSFYARPKS
jgi:hypothetical protein